MDETFQKILDLLLATNAYESPYAKAIGDTEPILTPLIRKRALQAAFISASSNFIPSYFGYFASLGEVYLLLKLQASMVKDIAVIFGKEKDLNKDLLLYCLFKNSHPNLWKGFIRFIGTRIILRPTSFSIFTQILKSLQPHIEMKLESNFGKQLFSFFGVLSLSTLSYLDTKIVGRTAIEIFSKEIIFEN
ncbi:MAG: hypothetical protein N3A69_11390 [Leptospiraceae bacterium]|nr:hypothetical protein [Leptospiraceae bacterium]